MNANIENNIAPTMPTDTIRYGYARVSKSSDDTQNLETQIKILESEGIRRELIFTDVISGATMKREGWQNLRKQVRSGDVIVLCYIDRLGRNLKDGLNIIQDLSADGIGIVALKEGIDTRDSNPMSKFIIHLFLIIAEWQLANTTSRIKDGLSRARQNNVRIGRPPIITETQAGYIAEEAISGISIAEIARRHKVSRGTVRNYRAKLEQKLAAERNGETTEGSTLMNDHRQPKVTAENYHRKMRTCAVIAAIGAIICTIAPILATQFLNTPEYLKLFVTVGLTLCRRRADQVQPIRR